MWDCISTTGVGQLSKLLKNLLLAKASFFSNDKDPKHTASAVNWIAPGQKNHISHGLARTSAWDHHERLKVSQHPKSFESPSRSTVIKAFVFSN